MSELSVCHYRCFKADKRMSMDIYADVLAAALQACELKLDSFQPASTLEKYGANSLVMRGLRYWQYPRSVRSQNADIHHVLDHGYAHLQPNFISGKTCASVHDLIPMLTWKGVIEQGEAGHRKRKPWLNLRSLSYLSKFDRLIAVSASTKFDLVEHLGISAKKIDVISPVISSIFKPANPEAIQIFASKYHLDTESRWLMISGSEFYKNHATALNVLKQLRSQSDVPIKLIKTGLPSKDFSVAVDELGLSSSVKSIFLEDFNELPLLYGFVDCLLFPSLYEGFGMPVAEALACGTPAVISNRGSLPEVGGELLRQYQPFDVTGLVEGVQHALSEEKFRSMVRKKGPQHVEQYRAPLVAQKLIRFYRSLVSDDIA